MFDEIELVKITTTKNKNGELIETEELIPVQALPQNISRESRDKYHDRGSIYFLRFKLWLFGDITNEGMIQYFFHNNVKYAVTDFIKDKTGTHWYIEGESVKGRL